MTNIIDSRLLFEHNGNDLIGANGTAMRTETGWANICFSVHPARFDMNVLFLPCACQFLIGLEKESRMVSEGWTEQSRTSTAMKKNTTYNSIKTTAILAIASVSVISIYEKIVLPIKPSNITDQFSALTNTAFELAALIVVTGFLWTAVNSKFLPRLIAWMLIMAAILTEYGYYYAMGRFSIIQDYTLGILAVNFDLIRNALAAFARWSEVLPLTGFTALLVLTRKNKRFGLGSLLLSILPIVLFFSAIFPFSHGTFPTLSISAGWRTLIFTGNQFAREYRGPREAVSPQPGSAPAKNIIFVVDESMRGDHLSLNGYERDTTPYLKELEKQGLLTNWGVSSSGGTSSLNSNVLLLAGVYELPDVNHDYRRKPTIFQYAKSLGYTTHHLDAQMDTLWLMSKNDLSFVDEWKKARDFTDPEKRYDVDLAVARYAREIVTHSTGNFIWINKMGVHFPYTTRLPAGADRWQPIQKDLVYDPKRQAEIKNTYDNAIAYNLDQFFRELLGPDGLENTIIVYTSDHGQTLSEYGESWPHSGETRNEANVPIFIISNSPLVVDTSYLAGHANLFPTLLDLLGFPPEQRNYPYAPSLLSAKPGDPIFRRYIFGTIDSVSASWVFPFD